MGNRLADPLNKDCMLFEMIKTKARASNDDNI